MPVEIGETGNGKRETVVYARASGRPANEIVSFRTQDEPGRLVLDPRVVSHDWNYTNNRESRFFDLRDTHWRLDTFVNTVAARDHAVVSLAPTVWYNDAAELTVGVRLRSNYLGRYNKTTIWVSRGTTGDAKATVGETVDFYARLENPVWLRRARTTQSFEAWSLEGRTGGRLRWQTETRPSWSSADRTLASWTAQVMVTRNRRFLDRALWEDGGTGELVRAYQWRRQSRSIRRDTRLSVGGGLAYASRADGARLERRYDTEPFGRATAALAVSKTLGAASAQLNFRVFAGAYLAASRPFKQRAIPVAGADPYETFDNPLIRSLGAPFVRQEFFYHSPGNGNLRGYDPSVGGRWIGAVNMEFERSVWRRRSGVIRTASLVAFADGAVVDTLAARSTSGKAASLLTDAGVGVRLGLRVGDVAFPLRVEFPLFVSRPGLAHNRRQGTDKIEFRWLIGLAPSF
jgi:hypothetical protein